MPPSSLPLTVVDPREIVPFHLLLTNPDSSLTPAGEGRLPVHGVSIDHYRALGPWAERDSLVTYTTEFMRDGVWMGISDYKGVRHLFVHGPVNTTLQSGIYTYTGTLLGTTLEVGAPILDGQDRQLINGKVEIVADMDLPFGNLTMNVTNLTGKYDLPVSEDLFYNLGWFQERGLFESFNRAGNSPGIVRGSFFGEDHVGGTVRHPDFDAVFAGKRP